MIPMLTGWRTEILPRGAAFTHPEGQEVGAIFYRERVQPLLRAGAILRGILGQLPGFVAEETGRSERLVTHDGEHGVLVTVTGTQHGLPAQRDFGFVFGDCFFSSVGGLCLRRELRAEFTALVRELCRRDVHALGVRRRRFWYAPPVGWQPLGHGLATEWLAPDYPRSHTTLMVYPANPIALLGKVSLASTGAALAESGHLIEEQGQPETVTSQLGLSGQRQELRGKTGAGATLLRDTVVLADGRYTYAIELTSGDPDGWSSSRALLTTLVESIEPVPPPTPMEAVAGLQAHWLG
jgi:hypothetical protein